jgi:hypothetical protein
VSEPGGLIEMEGSERMKITIEWYSFIHNFQASSVINECLIIGLSGTGRLTSSIDKNIQNQKLVAHTCNSTYLGGWDQEDGIWRPRKSSWDPISTNR